MHKRYSMKRSIKLHVRQIMIRKHKHLMKSSHIYMVQTWEMAQSKTDEIYENKKLNLMINFDEVAG